MPRLSLYRPEKGNDFKFLDRVINEEFQVGGTDIHIYKYTGPVNPDASAASPATPDTSLSPLGELAIQDVLLMENRDRNYDLNVYVQRGIYTMQDLDFNLSQFGLFLNNDTVLLHFHLRSTVEALGRKLIAGDVLELPHLRDDYGLNDSLVALKRFYVVQDVTRPTNGFSQTWYPHLLRAKCVPIVNTQEYSQILGQDAGAGNGSTLGDLMSTYQANIAINDQIIAQAEADAPKSGYDTKSYYVIPTKENGLVDIADTTSADVDASTEQAIMDASVVLRSPNKNFYLGYLTGDGIPPNGAPYGFGITFPSNPARGAFYLRTDYMPNTLFRYDGKLWVRYEDNVRMTLNNFGSQDAVGAFAGESIKQSQKASFFNNNNTSTIAGEVVPEKQALSKALKPKADN